MVPLSWYLVLSAFVLSCGLYAALARRNAIAVLMGIELMLNAVNIAEGIDEATIRKTLLKEHAIEIGAGLGPLAGRIWRIGLMGHTARPESVDRLLAAVGGMLPS